MALRKATAVIPFTRGLRALLRRWWRPGRPAAPPTVPWRDASPIPTGWRALDADGHLLVRGLTHAELREPPRRREALASTWLHRRRRDG